MFKAGDSVSRIGEESVDGLVLKVTVDMGDDPGTVLEVGVGNSVRKVQAGACGKGVEVLHARDFDLPPVEEIRRDGATMPVAEGADVTAGVN